jgi:hypothetical protein
MGDITMTSKVDALAELCSIIVACVKDMGPAGAPSGPMYAALMATGMSLDQYQTIMAGLVAAGKLKQVGHLYYAV